MRHALKIIVPATALVIGLGLSAASAAPAPTGLAPLKLVPASGKLVEKTRWVRHCWWKRHHRVCRRVWVRH